MIGAPAPVEVYDPATERWRVIPGTPSVVLPFGVVAVNGKIYVFGGDDKDFELSPIIEVFDTGFHNVEARGKLPTRWGELKAAAPKLILTAVGINRGDMQCANTKLTWGQCFLH